ncbi:MAG TPA: hypothetical protein VJM34_16305 [Novosphingobium sp.]|nr:hypothetical protein [Novosphingobium sp.]
MEIDFDRESWRPEADRRSGQPEWHVLRMRLRTAQEAARALGSKLASQLDASGSFAAGAARALDGFERDLTAVNPSASANGKSSACISAGGDKAHVSLFDSGDRGLK